MFEIAQLLDKIEKAALNEDNITELKAEPFASIISKNGICLKGVKYEGQPVALRLNETTFVSMNFLIKHKFFNLRNLWLAFASSPNIKTDRYEGNTGYIVVMYSVDKPAYLLAFDNNVKLAKIFVSSTYLQEVLNLLLLLEG